MEKNKVKGEGKPYNSIKFCTLGEGPFGGDAVRLSAFRILKQCFFCFLSQLCYSALRRLIFCFLTITYATPFEFRVFPCFTQA